MKLFKYGLPLAALALLASCSEDKIVENPSLNPSVPSGEAYMAINISIPMSMSTKDGDEEQYEPGYVEGTEDEYQVNNGTVLIFRDPASVKDATGTKGVEADFEYVCQGTLDTYAWEKDGSDQITANSKTAVATFNAGSIDTSDEAGDYYALVVLNKNKLNLDLTAADVQNSISATKFSEWQKEAQIVSNQTNLLNAKGFTMTNAPLLTVPSEDGATPTVATLVKINKENIGTNPTNLVPAAEIFVQRLAVKVTVAISDNAKNDSDWEKFIVNAPAGTEWDDELSDADYVAFTDWALDVRNKRTYPVQVADNYNNWKNVANEVAYWFKAQTPVKSDAGYRIFWAEDPNYTSAQQLKNGFWRLADTDLDDEYDEKYFTKAAYCYENTMDVKQMIQNQTTTAVFRGVYHIGGAEQAISFINFGTWKAPLDDEFLACGRTTENDEPDAMLSVKETIEAGIADIKLYNLFDLTVNGTQTYLDEVVNKDKEESDLATSLNDNQKKEAVVYFINAYNDGIDKEQTVDYYHNGVVFYRARINHFEPNEQTPRPKNFKTIDDYTNDHRGRFGVLRNNWYEVNLSSITGVGEPTIPSDEDLDIPDDDPDKQYMNISIHILSWAKRSYDYDF